MAFRSSFLSFLLVAVVAQATAAPPTTTPVALPILGVTVALPASWAVATSADKMDQLERKSPAAPIMAIKVSLAETACEPTTKAVAYLPKRYLFLHEATQEGFTIGVGCTKTGRGTLVAYVYYKGSLADPDVQQTVPAILDAIAAALPAPTAAPVASSSKVPDAKPTAAVPSQSQLPATGMVVAIPPGPGWYMKRAEKGAIFFDSGDTLLRGRPATPTMSVNFHEYPGTCNAYFTGQTAKYLTARPTYVPAAWNAQVTIIGEHVTTCLDRPEAPPYGRTLQAVFNAPAAGADQKDVRELLDAITAASLERRAAIAVQGPATLRMWRTKVPVPARWISRDMTLTDGDRFVAIAPEGESPQLIMFAPSDSLATCATYLSSTDVPPGGTLVPRPAYVPATWYKSVVEEKTGAETEITACYDLLCSPHNPAITIRFTFTGNGNVVATPVLTTIGVAAKAVSDNYAKGAYGGMAYGGTKFCRAR